MESYKEVNRSVYNKYAGQFEDFTKDYLEHILEDANLFLDSFNGNKEGIKAKGKNLCYRCC